MRLKCQPLAKFCVTGLRAHPLLLPASDILTPSSCCGSSLTKLNVNSFPPTYTHFLHLCLLVKKIPQSFLLNSFLDSSLFLAEQTQAIPLHLQQMPGSPSLFTLCQVSSQASVTSHWDCCPICLSGLSYGHMPNTTAQAVFLIC